MHAIRTPTSATVILRGRPYTVANDDHRFDPLCAAIEARDEDAALAVVSENDSLAQIFLEMGGVKVFGGHVSYNGQHLPTNYLANRILEFKNQGLDITVLTKFLDQAMANPDPRAATDLFRWCEANNYPLDEHGRIIGYKIVKDDYHDAYTGRFRHQVGDKPEMLREDCDPDPNHTCSRGLHFCSAAYLPYYGPSNQRVMLVAVSPTDVVAFPKDYGLSKARACRYEVIQEIDKETAASFFEGRGAIYHVELDDDEDEDENPGLENDDTVRCRANRTLAEACGYSVLFIPHADLEYQVLFGDTSLGLYLSEEDAWAFAFRHAIDSKCTFYQQRVNRLNTILNLPAETRLAEIEIQLHLTTPKRVFFQPLKAWLEDRLAACEAVA